MINQDNQKQSQNSLNKLKKDINELINEVENQLTELDLKSEQIQDELAKQIILLQRFGEYISGIQEISQSLTECNALQSKFYAVNLALSFLRKNKTKKIILAKNIRYDIEYFLNSKKPLGCIGNFFKRCVRGVRELPTPTKVLIGLAMAIPVYMIGIPVSFWIVRSLTDRLDALTLSPNTPVAPNPSPTPTTNFSANSSKSKKNIPQNPSTKHRLNRDQYQLVIMVALSGAFGSIVSILVRLEEYKNRDEYVGSVIPIVVGFAKPLIGTAFGIFVFALLSSKIISFPSIESNTPKESNTPNQPSPDNVALYYFYFSIAFLVGFSERLDNDIVERVGVSFGLQKTTEKFQEDIRKLTEALERTNNLIIINTQDKNNRGDKKTLTQGQETGENIKIFTPNEPANINTKSSQIDG
ncbi:MAG: hypothetical protein PUP90_18545 [Nostoc sp. S4]|nr:hypothetical protein [Nostoc sp. S4]